MQLRDLLTKGNEQNVLEETPGNTYFQPTTDDHRSVHPFWQSVRTELRISKTI